MRVRAKNFLITYPQCPLERQQLLDHINTCFPERPTEYIIARERHEDTNFHLHAYIRYDGPDFNVEHNRWLDIQGYHPNIQYVRFPSKAKQYCLKEDKEPLVSIGINLQEKGDWKEALSKSTREEANTYIKTNFPKEYVLNYSNIQKCLGETYRTRIEEYTPRYTTFIDLPHELQTYEPATGDRPKTIVLLGAAKLGKTEWARCHGKHIYSRGTVIYDDFLNQREGATYCVIDDLWSWEFTYLKDFIGGQPEVVIGGKYRIPKKLNWGLQTIICTNTKFWLEWKPHQQEYFNECTKIYKINKKLY